MYGAPLGPAAPRGIPYAHMSDRLTILFMPESAYGPTNNCIGIGKVLERFRNLKGRR